MSTEKKTDVDLKELEEVKDLLIPTEDAEALNSVHEAEEIQSDNNKGRLKILWITIGAVVVLSVVGLGIVYASPNLRQQWNAFLAGDLSAYKNQIRKKQLDRIRQIEMLTSNDYGSLTLVYTPKDAQVHITQYKWVQDCSGAKGQKELLKCLEQPFDKTKAKPETKEIDNPSLHLDVSKKQILDSLPLNDLPVKESSDDRKTISHYEYLITIQREGYKPRKFYITNDAKRKPPVKDAQLLVWVLRGPGLYMADFQGADLEPLPETAKDNYVKATIALYCVDKEIEKGRKAGNKYKQENIDAMKMEYLNKYGFKSPAQYQTVGTELMKDKDFAKELQKTLKNIDCSKQ